MDDASFDKLVAAGDRNRYDFLRTDLELCRTFLDLAKTELEFSEREAAARLLRHAETGYATIHRLQADLCNAEWKQEIETKTAELRRQIDSFNVSS